VADNYHLPIYPVHDSTPLHSCRAAGVGPSLDSGAANTHINTPTQTWVHYNLLENSVHLEVIWFVWWFFGIVERFNMVKLFYPPSLWLQPMYSGFCSDHFIHTMSLQQGWSWHEESLVLLSRNRNSVQLVAVICKDVVIHVSICFHFCFLCKNRRSSAIFACKPLRIVSSFHKKKTILRDVHQNCPFWQNLSWFVLLFGGMVRNRFNTKKKMCWYRASMWIALLLVTYKSCYDIWKGNLAVSSNRISVWSPISSSFHVRFRGASSGNFNGNEQHTITILHSVSPGKTSTDVQKNPCLIPTINFG
jgi:hypothetical protein